MDVVDRLAVAVVAYQAARAAAEAAGQEHALWSPEYSAAWAAADKAAHQVADWAIALVEEGRTEIRAEA